MRWRRQEVCNLPDWIRGDVPKYRTKPGMLEAARRAELAADVIDAVLATHLGCAVSVCPTMQAIYRVTDGEE